MDRKSSKRRTVKKRIIRRKRVKKIKTPLESIQEKVQEKTTNPVTLSPIATSSVATNPTTGNIATTYPVSTDKDEIESIIIDDEPEIESGAATQHIDESEGHDFLPVERGGENEHSEAGASKLLECPVEIKEEPVSPQYAKIMEWVSSVAPFDETGVPSEEPLDEPGVASEEPLDEPEVSSVAPFDEPGVISEEPLDEPEVASVAPFDEPGVAYEEPFDEPEVASAKPFDEPEASSDESLGEQKFSSVESLYEPGTASDEAHGEPEDMSVEPFDEPGVAFDEPLDEPEVTSVQPFDEPRVASDIGSDEIFYEISSDESLDEATSDKPLDGVASDKPLDEVASDTSLVEVTSDKPLVEVTSEKPLVEVTSEKPLVEVTSFKSLDEPDDLLPSYSEAFSAEEKVEKIPNPFTTSPIPSHSTSSTSMTENISSDEDEGVEKAFDYASPNPITENTATTYPLTPDPDEPELITISDDSEIDENEAAEACFSNEEENEAAESCFSNEEENEAAEACFSIVELNEAGEPCFPYEEVVDTDHVTSSPINTSPISMSPFATSPVATSPVATSPVDTCYIVTSPGPTPPKKMVFFFKGYIDAEYVNSTDEDDEQDSVILDYEPEVESVADNQYTDESEGDNQYTDESEGDNQHMDESEADNQHMDESEADNQHIYESEADNQQMDENEADNQHIYESEADNQHIYESEADNQHIYESEADNQHTYESEADYQHMDESEAYNQHMEENEADNQHMNESEVDNEHMDESEEEEQEFFKVEGYCVIYMAGQHITWDKAKIEPFTGNIGFIGCGPMAEAFIAYLIKTGHRVYGYNRTMEKWADVPMQPIIVSKPATLVENCDIIFCCVSDSFAVQEIMESPEGILDGMDHHSGKAFVEMSTVDPDIISYYYEKVNKKGGSYLNAQIMRSRPAAYMGCSMIKASGDQETFEKCQSCFISFSSYAVYLSSNVIEASILSISQQVMEFSSILSMSDSLLASFRIGVSAAAYSNALEMTHGDRSENLGVAAESMLLNRSEVFFPLKHVIKILRLTIKLKKSEPSGNELYLNALNLIADVLNRYPEAIDHDVSCVYKLRTPQFVSPVDERGVYILENEVLSFHFSPYLRLYQNGKYRFESCDS